MSVPSRVLDLLDDAVERCLGLERPEAALIELYFEFFEALKGRAGTAAGFTGLSEYLFFRYVMRRIETRTGAAFALPDGEDPFFRSASLLLCHDVALSRISPRLPRLRPDIALFREGSDGERRLLAAFEIKIYLVGRATLEEAFRRLEELARRSDASLFLVLFSLQYRERVERFCEEHSGRVWVVSKHPFSHRIGLDEAVERALSGGGG